MDVLICLWCHRSVTYTAQQAGSGQQNRGRSLNSFYWLLSFSLLVGHGFTTQRLCSDSSSERRKPIMNLKLAVILRISYRVCTLGCPLRYSPWLFKTTLWPSHTVSRKCHFLLSMAKLMETLLCERLISQCLDYMTWPDPDCKMWLSPSVTGNQSVFFK